MIPTLSTKDCPLVIETVVDESNSPSSYYTKGHTHDRETFIEAVKSASAQYDEYEAITELHESEIEYHWYRKRPLLPAEREEFCFGHWVDMGTPGTPGAFPVMVIYVA